MLIDFLWVHLTRQTCQKDLSSGLGMSCNSHCLTSCCTVCFVCLGKSMQEMKTRPFIVLLVPMLLQKNVSLDIYNPPQYICSSPEKGRSPPKTFDLRSYFCHLTITWRPHVAFGEREARRLEFLSQVCSVSILFIQGQCCGEFLIAFLFISLEWELNTHVGLLQVVRITRFLGKT